MPLYGIPTIEDSFAEFKKQVAPADCSADQLEGMRQCFMAGAFYGINALETAIKTLPRESAMEYRTKTIADLFTFQQKQADLRRFARKNRN